MCFAFRYENLMQINLESSEVDEISEIHTKLLRVSILQTHVILKMVFLEKERKIKINNKGTVIKGFLWVTTLIFQSHF